MESAQDLERRELELFDRRHKKLSGTSLMLCDKERRFIYKIIPEYTNSEATFYSLVNGLPGSSSSRSYARLRETLKRPEELARARVMPHFEGVVEVIEQDYSAAGEEGHDHHVRYFEGSGAEGPSARVFTAIKLENVLHSYARPAVIDIKLGMHNTLDNADLGGLSASTRAACVRRWQELKMVHKLEHSGASSTKRLYNITASDIGLGEPFSGMDPADLHQLLKSWRQKIVASQTTEDELGFRICSICIATKDGSLEVSASQAKLLKTADTLAILNQALGAVPTVRRTMVAVLEHIRDWVALQDQLSVAATSLLVTYDQGNPEACNVKWVDFTHVESIRHSPFSVLPGQSSMIKGIERLIAICRSLDGTQNLSGTPASCSGSCTCWNALAGHLPDEELRRDADEARAGVGEAYELPLAAGGDDEAGARHPRHERVGHVEQVAVEQARQACLVVLPEDGVDGDGAEGEAAAAEGGRGGRGRVGAAAQVVEEVHRDELGERAHRLRVAVDGEEHAEALDVGLPLVVHLGGAEQRGALLPGHEQLAQHEGLEGLLGPLGGAAGQGPGPRLVAHVVRVPAVRVGPAGEVGKRREARVEAAAEPRALEAVPRLGLRRREQLGRHLGDSGQQRERAGGGGAQEDAAVGVAAVELDGQVEAGVVQHELQNQKHGAPLVAHAALELELREELALEPLADVQLEVPGEDAVVAVGQKVVGQRGQLDGVALAPTLVQHAAHARGEVPVEPEDRRGPEVVGELLLERQGAGPVADVVAPVDAEGGLEGVGEFGGEVDAAAGLAEGPAGGGAVVRVSRPRVLAEHHLHGAVDGGLADPEHAPAHQGRDLVVEEVGDAREGEAAHYLHGEVLEAVPAALLQEHLDAAFDLDFIRRLAQLPHFLHCVVVSDLFRDGARLYHILLHLLLDQLLELDALAPVLVVEAALGGVGEDGVGQLNLGEGGVAAQLLRYVKGGLSVCRRCRRLRCVGGGHQVLVRVPLADELVVAGLDFLRRAIPGDVQHVVVVEIDRVEVHFGHRCQEEPSAGRSARAGRGPSGDVGTGGDEIRAPWSEVQTRRRPGW
ncbi:kinase, putative [Babesia caballi]|uniref:Kinase n=1 Tax=Babesia caballi TaxID=5871 RepID=A0AAV4LPZ0_BABCB|nr:kinase, putative [Babesia caballi]